MDASTSLSDGLIALAKKSLKIRAMCNNEESTKFHLVLPVIALLGYDPSNPYEVYPEYAAGFSDGDDRRVDLAILKDGRPEIAIECKTAGTNLASQRGQLRAYFNALLPVKVLSSQTKCNTLFKRCCDGTSLCPAVI